MDFGAGALFRLISPFHYIILSLIGRDNFTKVIISVIIILVKQAKVCLVRIFLFLIKIQLLANT